MRRLTIVLLSVVVAVVGIKTYALEFVSTGWVSVQLPGQNSALSTTQAGVGIGADVAGSAQWVEFGVGIQNLFARSTLINPSMSGNFQFFDFFASLRFPMVLGPMTLYPLGRIGYGLYSGDGTYTGNLGSLTGGLFYSVGLGFRKLLFGRTFLFVEGTYDNNFGSNTFGNNPTQTNLYSAVNLYT